MVSDGATVARQDKQDTSHVRVVEEVVEVEEREAGEDETVHHAAGTVDWLDS